jgi:hypothetical protein
LGVEKPFECALCGARTNLGLNVLEIASGETYWFCNWEHIHLWWEQLKLKVRIEQERKKKRGE